MKQKIALFSILILVLGACGTAKNTASEAVTSGRIDVSELSYPTEVLSAYDIVRRHKSNWLQKRGRSSIQDPTPVKVYRDNDGSSLGGIKSLRRISGQSVSTIEYYNPRKAQLKFGSGHGSGVIFVHTLEGDPDT